LKSYISIASAVLITVVVFSVTKPNTAYSDEPSIEKPQLVFLLIGQSNMAGRAHLEDEDRGPIEGTLLLNDKGTWEPATNPMNRYSTDRKSLGMQRIGPGDGFARKMREAKPETTIGLIVNARGGTAIELWANGKPLYDHTIERLRKAGQTKIDAVLWHQGESNSNDPQYIEKLVKLVETLRKDLGDPNLPFIAAKVYGNRPVNDHIAKLPEHVKGTAVVSAEELEVFDGVHFDRDSQKILGQRYANAYIEISSK